MIATVKAVPPAQFDAWLAYQKKLIAQANAAAQIARAKLNAPDRRRTGRKPLGERGDKRTAHGHLR